MGFREKEIRAALQDVRAEPHVGNTETIFRAALMRLTARFAATVGMA